MQIDTKATQLSHEEAEALLTQLYQMYHDREVDETALLDLLPILQEKGFAGLAYVLDIITNSKEMKERALTEMSQLWEEHLEYLPTRDERKRYEKQIRYFRNSAKEQIISNINQAESLRLQAAPLLISGDLGKAQVFLDEAVTFEPTPWLVWHDHGLVRYRQKNDESYEAAIPSYKKAIELNLDDSFIWSCEDLKWCYGNLGFKDPEWFDKGFSYFQEIIEERFPNRWIAWHECGWMLLKSGQAEKAIDFYLKAIELQTDPEWGWCYSDLLACYQAINKENLAYDYFANLAKNGSQNWSVWDSLGTLEWKYTKNPTGAIEYFTKSIENHPDGGWFWTWNSIGWCHKDSKFDTPQKYHRAFEAFEKAKEIDSSNWHVWHGMGWAKEMLGSWTKAIEYYQEALRLNSNSAQDWVGLGRSYRKMSPQKFINSWEAYQKALQLAPVHSYEYKAANRGLTSLENKPWIELRKILTDGYDLDEIRTLCFDLNIKYQELDGNTLTSKVISLIEYCERRNRLEDVMQSVRAERPKLIPLTVPDKSQS